jgi:hypothetical protein
MTLHLGVRNHPVANEKCWEIIEETKMLFTKEVDLNAKISTIPLSVSKTFLASYLLYDSNDGIMKFIKGEQL